MKIDFSQKLKNLDDSVSEEAPTLSLIAVRALVETLPGDETSTGEDKFKRAVLAQSIMNGGEVNINAEDVSIIKKRVGIAFGASIVYATWTALGET